MSVMNKILVEIRQAGKIVANWHMNAVPRKEDKIIVLGKAFEVKDVYWSRDSQDHYDAWVQVLIEAEGQEL